MVGDTRWHPDNANLIHTGLKFTIYPEPLTAASGALRVIPGSHREPYHSSVSRDVLATYGVPGDQIPAYAFESNSGDVLVFHQGLWHAAFGGSTQRRLGVLVYLQDPETDDEVRDIQEMMRRHHRGHAQAYRGRPFYGDYWRSMPDPRHQRWVRRLEELAILETPNLAELGV